MTRDETIALFQKCEQARADALAAGKPKEEAHEAAKAIWNDWADELLAASAKHLKTPANGPQNLLSSFPIRVKI